MRFVCGALFGLFVGWHAFGFGSVTWWELVFCGVVFGVVAGWFGDRFWYAFFRSFWW